MVGRPPQSLLFRCGNTCASPSSASFPSPLISASIFSRLAASVFSRPRVTHALCSSATFRLLSTSPVSLATKCEKFSIQYRGISPDSSAALSASGALVLELQEMIYRHCLEKFTSRVNKRDNKFQEFFRTLSAHIKKQGLNQRPDAHLWETLRLVAHILRYVEELLRTHTATTLPFTELVKTMGAMTSWIHTLIQSPSVLRWSFLVPGKFKHPKTVYIPLAVCRFHAKNPANQFLRNR
jgi:hypothetical protein